MRLKKVESEYLKLARVCRVATFEETGQPHCVPVCPVSDGKQIYFASDKSAKKVKNLKHNPSLSITFDDYSEAWSGLRGVMIQGTGKIIERGSLFQKARRLLYTKYPQYEKEAPIGERDSVIVEVTPERAFSWGLS
jgi:nitroimidazol reductase NimA-like FMN-containing flavoprotein (pyridoxamine 5'-phosphate oxidase superfamily)